MTLMTIFKKFLNILLKYEYFYYCKKVDAINLYNILEKYHKITH